jgi:hypothetical protein
MTHPRVLAMQRRIILIRKVVAVCAVAAFLALFATIYVQMATGRDPVLGTTTAHASTAGSSGSATSQESDSSEPAPVTTAQS